VVVLLREPLQKVHQKTHFSSIDHSTGVSVKFNRCLPFYQAIARKKISLQSLAVKLVTRAVSCKLFFVPLITLFFTGKVDGKMCLKRHFSRYLVWKD
jgi:hypothetical protein